MEIPFFVIQYLPSWAIFLFLVTFVWSVWKLLKKSDLHCFLKITFRVHFTGFGGGTGGILCYFSSETIITCICQINVQFAKCIFPICQMYLSNLPNVFIQFAKCICPIGKMYLSYLQNVFVQFDKCICPPLVEALLVPLNQQNGSKPQNSPKPRCYNRKRTPIYVQHVQLFLDAPESLDLYPCEWVGRSVGRVSNSKHRSPLAYDLEIMSSC